MRAGTENGRTPGGPERETDIRGLLTRREYIKTAAYTAPRRTKRQILELMERLRQARRPGKNAGSDRAAPLPEMTGGELVREINWRLGTLPPADAVVVAAYVQRVTGWRRARRPRGVPEGVRRPYRFP